MPKKFQKTLSLGLSGLLALGIGIANAADTTAPRLPNVLHEMVPHVVLPETIQYNKTAKTLPGTGYTGVSSPYVATYIAYPSYQVPPATAFKPVGQSVYPVSPKLLPAPLPQEESTPEDAAEAKFVLEDRNVNLTDKVVEPIRLATASESVVPILPMPNNGAVMQTGMFCQHPAGPPSAWAFSSPIFKVASVPAGWGGGQAGGIVHSSPRGSQQQAVFSPVDSTDPEAAGSAMPQGIPYSTFQMGRQAPEQGIGTQAQVLPNGMILLTMPPDHSNCGLVRCRTGNAPRTLLLPPAGYGLPQPLPPGMGPQGMQAPPLQGAMMPAGFGMPPMPMPQPPQMQSVPVTVMTPMGPAIVGYQQMPMMNPMVMPSPAMLNPAVAAQVPGAAADTGDEALQTSPMASPMALVATPYGYTLQVPAEASQADVQMQVAQMQQALMQSQMAANPYAGYYTTPFGYVPLNPAGQFGGYGMPMMNVGYQPAGMFGGGQGGMTVSDMIQIMAFMNNNKSHRRARLADRLAERRENRKSSSQSDPFAQLMQAWSTPFVAPDTTLRMPSRNAYPYGYFGTQALPVDTANYGGYHNLYFGSTSYPGLY